MIPAPCINRDCRGGRPQADLNTWRTACQYDFNTAAIESTSPPHVTVAEPVQNAVAEAADSDGFASPERL